MSHRALHRIFMTAIVLTLVTTVAYAAGPIVTTDMTGGLTATQLANLLVATNGGVTISNAQFSGNASGAGAFTGGNGIVGFNDGIILASGRIADVVGPNSSDSMTTDFLLPGDANLDALIPGYTTYDATVLEFDFVPQGALVTFQYVFTSEEYNEFVNSPFNDVFGFFINGVNYALLPDGVTAVAINNVNNGNPYGSGGTNPSFFINNDLSDGGGSINIQADGLTVVLTLTAPVNANQTNHMKLAIADAGDHVLDSWVFVKGGSFKIAEICGNGIDDDQDGYTDNQDTDCQVCSDGDLDPGEECDDGNIVDGDGCSATCKFEPPPPGPPNCTAAYASPGVIWSPNHKMIPVTILGVTDPDGDLVSISAVAITQDEPVVMKGLGSGNTAPDGQLAPLAVRAERDGNGSAKIDGRVYHIDFTASDGTSACSGTVVICVPHDQRPGGGCIDGGRLFNSTQKP